MLDDESVESLNLVGDAGRVDRQCAVYVCLLLVRDRLVFARSLRRKEPPRNKPRQAKQSCRPHDINQSQPSVCLSVAHARRAQMTSSTKITLTV